MASGNSRIRLSISPIWLDCSIWVYIEISRFVSTKNWIIFSHKFFFCLHKPTSNRYLFILLCESRRWDFFRMIMFCLFLLFFCFLFFLLNRLRVYCQIHLSNYWAIKFRATKVILFSKNAKKHKGVETFGKEKEKSSPHRAHKWAKQISCLSLIFVNQIHK